MAERRMFSKTIIDSDVFLDMPLSTQALYFHLSMRADDEGFINNPKKIMRMIGASQDELKFLLAKRYLLSFDSGVVVVKHWKIHNYIQKDRFKATLYKEEKDLIQTKKNRSYTESYKELDTDCIQDGDTGKVSLDEESEEENNKRYAKYDPSADFVFFNDSEFQEVWKDYLSVRTKKKAAKSDRAIKAVIKKLNEYSKGSKENAILIVSKSADSGWSDIYELKPEEMKKVAKKVVVEPWTCNHGGAGKPTRVEGAQCKICGDRRK